MVFMGIQVLAFAQQAKVISAFNYNKTGELDLAKEAIDLASVHEGTMGKPKTWYYRGIVYHNIYETKVDKYKNLSGDPLNEANKSYEKALELDTKNEYSDDIKKRIGISSIQLLNMGVFLFNEKKYPESMVAFENSLNINQKYFNKIDTLAIANAGLAAERSSNEEKAKFYYNKMIQLGAADANTFRSLAKIYREEKDTTSAMDALRKARVAFPNDPNLIIDELNYYLERGKNKEAEENLKLAIEKEPMNKNLYFALGTIKDNAGNFEEAELAYQKSIEIDPEYFDAIYNLGALYFNKGVKINEAANAITDDKKYQMEVKKADEIFAKALIPLEKAYKINPNDQNTLISLKQIYARTGNNEMYKIISEKLKG